ITRCEDHDLCDRKEFDEGRDRTGDHPQHRPRQSDYLVSVRKRKTSGGSKWNVDFANFPELTTVVRDAVGVNFGHQKYCGQYPNIRQVRIGSTKFVQELI